LDLIGIGLKKEK